MSNQEELQGVYPIYAMRGEAPRPASENDNGFEDFLTDVKQSGLNTVEGLTGLVDLATLKARQSFADEGEEVVPFSHMVREGFTDQKRKEYEKEYSRERVALDRKFDDFLGEDADAEDIAGNVRALGKAVAFCAMNPSMAAKFVGQNAADIALIVGSGGLAAAGAKAAATKVAARELVKKGVPKHLAPGIAAKNYAKVESTVARSTAAAGEGAVSAGHVAGTIADYNYEQGKDPTENLGWAAAAGAATGAVGYGMSRAIPGAGVEAAIANKAARKELLGGANSFGKANLRSAGAEALEEGLQTPGEHFAENYGTDKPLMQGLGSDLAQGMIAGGAMGSGGHALSKGIDSISKHAITPRKKTELLSSANPADAGIGSVASGEANALTSEGGTDVTGVEGLSQQAGMGQQAIPTAQSRVAMEDTTGSPQEFSAKPAQSGAEQFDVPVVEAITPEGSALSQQTELTEAGNSFDAPKDVPIVEAVTPAKGQTTSNNPLDTEAADYIKMYTPKPKESKDLSKPKATPAAQKYEREVAFRDTMGGVIRASRSVTPSQINRFHEMAERSPYAAQTAQAMSDAARETGGRSVYTPNNVMDTVANVIHRADSIEDVAARLVEEADSMPQRSANDIIKSDTLALAAARLRGETVDTMSFMAERSAKRDAKKNASAQKAAFAEKKKNLAAQKKAEEAPVEEPVAKPSKVEAPADKRDEEPEEEPEAPAKEPEPAKEEPKPEPKPEPEPAKEEPKPEPKPEPEPVKEEPKPEPEPKPVKEEPKPEPEPVKEEVKPEPKKEAPKPKAKAKPKAEAKKEAPKPKAKAKAKPKAEAKKEAPEPKATVVTRNEKVPPAYIKAVREWASKVKEESGKFPTQDEYDKQILKMAKENGWSMAFHWTAKDFKDYTSGSLVAKNRGVRKQLANTRAARAAYQEDLLDEVNTNLLKNSPETLAAIAAWNNDGTAPKQGDHVAVRTLSSAQWKELLKVDAEDKGEALPGGKPLVNHKWNAMYRNAAHNERGANVSAVAAGFEFLDTPDSVFNDYLDQRYPNRETGTTSDKKIVALLADGIKNGKSVIPAARVVDALGMAVAKATGHTPKSVVLVALDNVKGLNTNDAIATLQGIISYTASEVKTAEKPDVFKRIGEVVGEAGLDKEQRADLGKRIQDGLSVSLKETEEALAEDEEDPTRSVALDFAPELAMNTAESQQDSLREHSGNPSIVAVDAAVNDFNHETEAAAAIAASAIDSDQIAGATGARAAKLLSKAVADSAKRKGLIKTLPESHEDSSDPSWKELAESTSPEKAAMAEELTAKVREVFAQRSAPANESEFYMGINTACEALGVDLTSLYSEAQAAKQAGIKKPKKDVSLKGLIRSAVKDVKATVKDAIKEGGIASLDSAPSPEVQEAFLDGVVEALSPHSKNADVATGVYNALMGTAKRLGLSEDTLADACGLSLKDDAPLQKRISAEEAKDKNWVRANARDLIPSHSAITSGEFYDSIAGAPDEYAVTDVEQYVAAVADWACTNAGYCKGSHETGEKAIEGLGIPMPAIWEAAEIAQEYGASLTADGGMYSPFAAVFGVNSRVTTAIAEYVQSTLDNNEAKQTHGVLIDMGRGEKPSALLCEGGIAVPSEVTFLIVSDLASDGGPSVRATKDIALGLFLPENTPSETARTSSADELLSLQMQASARSQFYKTVLSHEANHAHDVLWFGPYPTGEVGVHSVGFHKNRSARALSEQAAMDTLGRIAEFFNAKNTSKATTAREILAHVFLGVPYNPARASAFAEDTLANGTAAYGDAEDSMSARLAEMAYFFSGRAMASDPSAFASIDDLLYGDHSLPERNAVWHEFTEFCGQLNAARPYYISQASDKAYEKWSKLDGKVSIQVRDRQVAREYQEVLAAEYYADLLANYSTNPAMRQLVDTYLPSLKKEIANARRTQRREAARAKIGARSGAESQSSQKTVGSRRGEGRVHNRRADISEGTGLVGGDRSGHAQVRFAQQIPAGSFENADVSANGRKVRPHGDHEGDPHVLSAGKVYVRGDVEGGSSDVYVASQRSGGRGANPGTGNLSGRGNSLSGIDGRGQSGEGSVQHLYQGSASDASYAGVSGEPSALVPRGSPSAYTQLGGSGRGNGRGDSGGRSQIEAARKLVSKIPNAKARYFAQRLSDGLFKSSLGAMFTKDLVNVGGRVLKSIKTWGDLVERSSGYANDWKSHVAAIKNDFDALPEKAREAVNEFLTDSTLEGVWGYRDLEVFPTKKAWDEYCDSLSEDNKAYQEMLQQMFTDLPGKARDVARNVLRHGVRARRVRFEILQETTTQNYANLIAKATSDLEAKELEKERDAHIRTIQLEAKNNKAPYVPLKRFGSHVTVMRSRAYAHQEALVNRIYEMVMERTKGKPTFSDMAPVHKARAALQAIAQNGQDYYVEFSESQADADLVAQDLKAQHPDAVIQAFERTEFLSSNVPSWAKLEQVMLSAKQQLEIDSLAANDNGSAARAIREMMSVSTRMYIEALTDTNARKSELRRRKVRGFHTNMMENFAEHGNSEAYLLANMKYSQRMRDALTGIVDETRVSKDRATASVVQNEIMKRYQLMLKGNDSKLVNTIMRGTSAHLLMTNPSYYLQNILQPMMMSAPYMAGKYGKRAFGLLSSNMVEVSKWLAKGKGLDDLAAKLSEEEYDALMDARKVGHIDVGMTQDFGRVTSSGNKLVNAAIRASDRMAGWSRNVEIVNRVATFLTAYRLAKGSGKSKEQAYEYADEVVYRTHGDYSSFNAPRYFHMNGAMRLATQFRKFQLIQLGMMCKMLKDSFIGATAEERVYARRAFMWTMGTHALIAGAKGTPFVATAMALSALLFGAPGDDDDDMFRKMIGNKDIADLVLYGMPKAMGVNMSQKVGASNMLSIYPFFEFRPEKGKENWYDLLGNIVGPGGSILARTWTGMQFVSQGDYWKGIEQCLPTGLFNTSKAVRFGTQGVTTKGGDVLIPGEDFSLFDMITQAAGTPSNIIDDQNRVRSSLYRHQTTFEDAANRIRMDYKRAVKNHDFKGKAEARRAWVALNRERRRAGFSVQPLSTLVTSATSQRKRERSVMQGIPVTNADKRFVKRALSQ